MTKLTAGLVDVGLLSSFSTVIGLANTPAKGTSTVSDADMIGIEELHQQDVAATLSGDPQQLAELWTDEAVRLEPGRPAEIGKLVIRVNTERAIAKNPEFKILTYEPEIMSVKIVEEWAFEWGYFDASYRDGSESSVKSFRANLLRVLRKQSNGSWKFARAMWNLAE